jgi:preprotein translocase subunit YajC
MSAGALALIILLLLFGFFALVRPQRRHRLEQTAMQESIATGDEVLTAGGIFGFVKGVDEDEVRVEIAPGTTIRVAKRAVAAVIPTEEEESSEAIAES